MANCGALSKTGIEKRGGEERETEGRKTVRKLLEDDELDRGEELPINAFLSCQTKPNQISQTSKPRTTTQTPQLAFHALIWSPFATDPACS